MKNEKIYIRAFFGDWKEVTREKAKEFIQNFEMPCVGILEKNIYLQKHLKGITIDELLKE